jgi:hypothetical protein
MHITEPLIPQCGFLQDDTAIENVRFEKLKKEELIHAGRNHTFKDPHLVHSTRNRKIATAVEELYHCIYL